MSLGEPQKEIECNLCRQDAKESKANKCKMQNAKHAIQNEKLGFQFLASLASWRFKFN
jgi:hypothetical protein